MGQQSNTQLSKLNSYTKLSRALGLGKNTLRRWVAADKFPQPTVVVNGRNYWTDEVVESFLSREVQHDL